MLGRPASGLDRNHRRNQRPLVIGQVRRIGTRGRALHASTLNPSAAAVNRLAPLSQHLLRDRKILVTGASGRIASALSMKLAGQNEVWGIARFGNEKVRGELQEAGVKTCSVDLVNPDFSGLPEDFDHVLHLAAYLGGGDDFGKALDINAVGTGLVLSHFRRAASALVMSTTGVYRPHPGPWHRYTETDPLGDPINPSTPTYGVTKVAQEGTARLCARLYGLPVVIARMNASYGPRGGLPVTHLDKVAAGETIRLRSDPAPYSPIHDDDIADHIEGLLAAASVPATVVMIAAIPETRAMLSPIHSGPVRFPPHKPRRETSPPTTTMRPIRPTPLLSYCSLPSADVIGIRHHRVHALTAAQCGLP